MIVLAAVLMFIVAPLASVMALITLLMGRVPRTPIRGRKHSVSLLGVAGVAFVGAASLAPSPSGQATHTASPATPAPVLVATSPTSPPSPTPTARVTPSWAPDATSRANVTSPAPTSPSRETSVTSPDEPADPPATPASQPTTVSVEQAAPEPTVHPGIDSGPAVYFANCTQVKQAGAAPLYRGDPGYRSALDRDDDGVACEKQLRSVARRVPRERISTAPRPRGTRVGGQHTPA